MTKYNPWRIDSEIYTRSYWHILMVICWSVSVLCVMVLADLRWWQWIVMIVVLALTTWWYQQQKLQVVHITQGKLDQTNDKWLIFVKEYDQKECWQGDLSTIYVSKHLLVLTFQIVEPFDYDLSVSVWRDQVDDDQWRKLQTLGNLIT